MSVVFFLMSISSIAHVDFEKLLCRCVEFKGQRPQSNQELLSLTTRAKQGVLAREATLADSR